jgi:hypothetical protein
MRNKLLALLLSLSLVSPSWAAMAFDGTNDRAETAATMTIGATGTVAMWVKRTGSGVGYEYFLSKTDDIGGTRLRMGADAGDFDFSFALLNRVDCGDNFVLNRWHHAAIVWSGVNVSLYFDGDLTYTASSSPEFPTTNNALFFANYETDANEFEGELDDIRFYSRALSASEIETLAKSRLRVELTDGLVGHWPLDGGTDGATALGTYPLLDVSGNGNHATPINSPTWRASSWISYP